MPTDPSQSVEAVKALAERLAQLPHVAALSRGEHNEPWTLAQSLSEIAGSCSDYLDALPEVMDPETRGDDLMQALIVLTTDLQHILYHLEDPRFFRELFAPLRAEWDEARNNA